MNKSFIALVVVITCGPALAHGPDNAQQTQAYLRSLQTKDGGFIAYHLKPTSSKISMPSLRATSTAIRALRYFGGDVPGIDACRRYVDFCFDPSLGGFADSPTGQPNVVSTAVGLMAAVELKMQREKYIKPSLAYLEKNAKSFEDIRIAVAAFETAQAPLGESTKKAWLTLVEQMRGPDGLFGSGLGQARETGGACAALLRMGEPVGRDREKVVQALLNGQRADGGYGKSEVDNSDLESTYRTVRCLMMLKAKPDREKCLSLIARCRNADGGYGISPGQESQVGPTYFAAIITYWLNKKD